MMAIRLPRFFGWDDRSAGSCAPSSGGSAASGCRSGSDVVSCAGASSGRSLPSSSSRIALTSWSCTSCDGKLPVGASRSTPYWRYISFSTAPRSYPAFFCAAFFSAMLCPAGAAAFFFFLILSSPSASLNRRPSACFYCIYPRSLFIIVDAFPKMQS